MLPCDTPDFIITVDSAKRAGACHDGLAWAAPFLPCTYTELLARVENNTQHSYALWGLNLDTKHDNETRVLRFARGCAERCVKLCVDHAEPKDAGHLANIQGVMDKVKVMEVKVTPDKLFYDCVKMLRYIDLYAWSNVMRHTAKSVQSYVRCFYTDDDIQTCYVAEVAKCTYYAAYDAVMDRAKRNNSNSISDAIITAADKAADDENKAQRAHLREIYLPQESVSLAAPVGN